MADLKEALRGLARAMGPDVIGGPVDASQDLVNLLLAGGGTAAHKLGLISAEQLPQALSGSPGTSDWWAKQVKLEDRGAPEYTAGRLAPLAAAAGPAVRRGTSALVDALAAAPQGIEAQRGAIRVGGRQDLMPSHQTSLAPMLRRGGYPRENPLPQELYSPSIGITKDKLMSSFGGGSNYGSVWAIPRVGAFDPQYSNSTLFNRDAYTPRWSAYQGRRADDWGSVKERMEENPDAYYGKMDAGRLMGRQRLSDRLNLRQPDDVRMMEGGGGVGTGDFGHNLTIDESPVFRSFSQFERDPRGAQTLDRDGGPGFEVEQALRPVNSILADLGLMNTHDFTSMAVLKDYLTSASTRVGGAGKEALEEAMQHLEVAKRLAARSPSEYAELKAHGPVPLNSNRFAGLIISPSRTLQREWEQFAGAIEVPENVKSIRRLLEQADSRGLDRQLLHPDEVDESTLFTLADAMQKAAGPVKERSFKEQKFFPGWRPPHPAAGKKAPLKEAPLPVLAPAPEVPSEATLKWFPETGKMTPEQFKAWFATEKGAEKAATPKKSPWPFPDSSL